MAVDLTQEEWAEGIVNDTDVVILDVRTEDEVSQGSIPNHVHLDIREGQLFLEGLESLDKSKKYYVYCRSGARSGQACQVMEQMGFDTTYNLEGGFMNWTGDIQD